MYSNFTCIVTPNRHSDWWLLDEVREALENVVKTAVLWEYGILKPTTWQVNRLEEIVPKLRRALGKREPFQGKFSSPGAEYLYKCATRELKWDPHRYHGMAADPWIPEYELKSTDPDYEPWNDPDYEAYVRRQLR